MKPLNWMPAIFLIIMLITPIAGCSSESKPFPPPEGYSNWEEYNNRKDNSPSIVASVKSTPIASQIEDKWERITIDGIGYIDYPTNFLEIQSEEYLDAAEKALQQTINSGEVAFTLQQIGLNELLPSAFESYKRVKFWTYNVKPGEEVYRANEKYHLSQAELSELHDYFAEQFNQEIQLLSQSGFTERLIESYPLEVVEVNGMFPLLYKYKRQINDNPIVLVEIYMFQDYDKIHYLSFSHRVVEEECVDIFNKMLESFRIQ